MMVERYPNLKEEVGGSIPGCKNILRARPLTLHLHLHLHLHFYIRDADADAGMTPSGPFQL
jgi:hypothetical protein